MKVYKSINKNQIFFIPTVGFINGRNYYGYKVFNISFAWLIFGISFKFGEKKWEENNG